MQYPLTKEEAGPHYWYSLHSVASEYPDRGSERDTEEFRQFVHYFISHFPCHDCKKHGLYYFHNNPPKGTSRKEVFNWACKFHNYVNKHTNKKEIECDTLLSDGSCKTCFSPHKVLTENVPLRLSDMRDSSVKLFESLCTEEGLPVPRIIFKACPPFPWTSCTKINDDNSNAVVYLNPTQYGVKTVVHEFVHYREKMKGNDMMAANEYEVDKMARNIVNKHFPTELEIKDIEESNVSISTKNMNPLVLTEDDSPVMEKRMSSIKKRFPHYGNYLDSENFESKQAKAESNRSGGGGDGGFVSMFDDVYLPLGQLLGVDKRDLSTVQVSQIVGSVAGALMDANLSPLGSVVASTISSVALFGTGVFARDSMSRGDRRFLANLSSNLFYGNIRVLANPRELPTVMENAKISGSYLARLDVGNLISSLSGDYYKRAYEGEYGIPIGPGGTSPPSSTPSPIVPQNTSPPLSQGIGTRFGPGQIASAQERAFGEAGPVRRYRIGPGVAIPPGDTDLGTYGPIQAGPVPFPEITPAIPVDDYFDPGNPNVGNPGGESIASLRSAAAAIAGPAVESDRFKINLYNDQDYVNQAVGYGDDTY